MFFGLGSDGTVGSNKASVKIIGESTDLWAQGYFVYDSKKSGSVTVSHLRFGPDPIRSTYLVQDADFIACHQFGLLDQMPVLANAQARRDDPAQQRRTPRPTLWDHLPLDVQSQIIDKQLDVWVIDASAVARDAGMGNRINTVMQPCFFKLSGRPSGRRGDRQDQEVGVEHLLEAGPSDRRPQLRRHRRVGRRASNTSKYRPW